MLKSPASQFQPSNPGRKTAQAWRAARFLIAPSLLLATFAFSCSDDDESFVGSTGGSGGTGASGGSAGTSGGGGNGGTSVAGAAGMGGSAGSGAGAGGSAGTGNMAGSAGTAGTGGALNDPDAGDGGVDTDSGSSPPPIVTQQDAANAICALEDQVASCDAPPNTCPDDQITGWDFFKTTYPNCVATIDAYFFCIANEPVTSYDCFEGTTPEVTSPQPGACADEEAAFQGVQAETDPCTAP